MYLPVQLPSDDEANNLIARLVLGDPIAPSDLALAYFDYLVGFLKRNNWKASEEDCVTAAGDAILSLIKNPSSYDPNRSSLQAYLQMSASGDLKNLWKSKQPYLSRETHYETVELSPDERKYLWDENTDPAFHLEARQEHDLVERILDEIRTKLTPQECKVLDLMSNGERQTSVYAEALEVSELDVAEQEREVKRVKDRLKKRLERAGEGLKEQL
jgi:hypothetical protein